MSMHPEPANDDNPVEEVEMSATPGATSWWLAIEERRKGRPLVPTRNKWMALALGQAIALVATSMNAASFTLSYHSKVDTQLFQLFIMYICLSGHLLLRERRVSEEGLYTLPFTRIRLQLPWWTYFLMSILDIIPNYMQLFSFRYTSLTSTTLLGSLAVASTMFFSSRILSRYFVKSHYFGVLLCVIGGGLTVWSDFDKEKGSPSGVHSGLGDLLAVVAALIYGLGDVISEYCVKNVDLYELLGMLGLYGAIFTGLSFPWIERAALSNLIWERSSSEQWEIAGIFLWYIASVLLYYITEALFLVASDATLLNLSMQASNLWAILFSLVCFHTLPPLLFYPALVLVVSGVALYEWKPTVQAEECTESTTVVTTSGNAYASVQVSEDDSNNP
jgi:solute carrier family 35 protein F1/2